MSPIKVRFAPSPTGPLHIGGARSALFNWLWARHTQGSFVLRIEDTDLERSQRKYEDEILKSLKWLGLDWDEGVDVGGPSDSYRQTERLAIYERYTQELLAAGHAYPCFCTDEELAAERAEQLRQGQDVKYSGKCCHLTAAEITANKAAGLPYCIRLRIPQDQPFIVDDMVRGAVSFDPKTIGDFVIAKSDGIPTYNYAVVIDDHLMGITHVVRAEEHLSNTPRQLAVYNALNFPQPKFAHISLILGNDRQKMSKRHGATSLMQYREMGYLPEAMLNFLALLGWSPTDEEEIMTPAELIAAFTLERVTKSPAVFDINKLNYINQQHMKRLSTEDLGDMARPFWEKSDLQAAISSLSPSRYELLVTALHDRLVCLADFPEQAAIFFRRLEWEEEALNVLKSETAQQSLNLFLQNLPLADASPAEIKKALKALIKTHKINGKDFYIPLRSALTGMLHGVDLPYLIAFWGQDEVQARISKSQQTISQ